MNSSEKRMVSDNLLVNVPLHRLLLQPLSAASVNGYYPGGVWICEGATCAHFKETADMKRTAFALLAMLLLSSSALYAQKTTTKSVPTTATPDLTKLNVEKMLQQLAPATAQSDGQETSPLQVVAEFLQLRPGQITELGQLLQARQAALVPLFQTAQALTQQLAVLLSSGGNPAQIGAVVIQIHGLQQQIAQVQQAFLTQFVATLDADQAQKLQAVQIAAQLQPVLPAFQPIFLF
jgi:hypothetical protein